jgi:nicotinamide N-methyltransferase
VKTIQQTLKKTATARALVFFTPYRPWLLQKDLAFFDLAREAGFAVSKIFEHVMDKVMFAEDPGVSHCPIYQARYGYLQSAQDELLRRTVYGYELRWEQPAP